MLPRTEESVRHTLADWLVAVEEEPLPRRSADPGLRRAGAADRHAGRSALAGGAREPAGQGARWHIVLELVQMARMRGFLQVCALTLREQFFVRLGFELVDRWSISPKVWQACIYCRKFHHCDEVAVLMNLVDKPDRASDARATPAWSHLLKWSEWQPLKLAYSASTSRRLSYHENDALSTVTTAI